MDPRHLRPRVNGLLSSRRIRSRSYSPVSSRLRHRDPLRGRPPPVPQRSGNGTHRSHRSEYDGDSRHNGPSPRQRSYENRHRRSRSRSYSRSRSRSRGRSVDRSRSRSPPGHSRTRKRSDTRSRTGSRVGYRSGRLRKNGRERHEALSRSNTRLGSRREYLGPLRSYNRSRDRSRRSDRARRGKKRRTGSRRDSRRKYRERDTRSDGDRDESDDSTSHDDTVGSYDGKPGDYIANRYKIIREAGLGTFGRVLECLDKHRDIVVAIKVVRKVEKYSESAKIEASILHDVNEKDERNESLCVQMYKWFEYKGHVCLVFERLGCSLYEYLKSHDYKPFPLDCIRAYAWQLLTALEFIHSIKLIHTDLKPENILLVDDEEESSSLSSPSSTSSCGSPNGHASQWSSRRHSKQRDRGLSDADTARPTLRPPAFNAVKLIDFGGATYDDESKSSIINTRQYRSPEVILGLGWGYPSDIWSAGCILAELYIGELLFATHENMEHLALIEKCIGRLPKHMVTQAQKDSAKFFRHGRLWWPEQASSQDSIEHVRKMRTLEEIIQPEDAEKGFLDLLQLMLVLDPEDRITAKEALNHTFFDGFSRCNITSSQPSHPPSSSRA